MNAKYFAEGVAEYQKRLAAFAAFRIIELPEEKIEEKNASDAVVKKMCIRDRWWIREAWWSMWRWKTRFTANCGAT